MANPVNVSPVMVGVDTSEGARSALRWANEWARSAGMPVLAVASWQYPQTAALPGGPTLVSPDEMDALTGEELRSTLVDELGEDAEGMMTLVQRGPAAWALLAAAERESAALLVVGRRGLGSLEGRLLGSVSRRVAELSPCPVAIVPTEWRGTGAVVVGVDGSPGASRALDWAITAAARDGRQVVVVHGLAGIPSEVGPSAIDRFVERAHVLVDRHAARVTGAGLEVVKVVRVEDPRELIRRVADEYDASVVVVGGQGDGPVSGTLVGSVVHHVVHTSEHPVVIVPD